MIIQHNFCNCEDSRGTYTELEQWGYWDCCSNCNQKLEDGFHYYDEPELY